MLLTELTYDCVNKFVGLNVLSISKPTATN